MGMSTANRLAAFCRIFALLAVGGALAAAAGAQSWRGPVSLGIEVQDGDENPLSGAEVRLEYAEVEPYSGPPPLTTDAAGRAEVFGLAEGLWRVQVDREGFSRYLVVLRLDPSKKKVLITAGPLRDATAPPLEVSFVKSESRVARGEVRRGRGGEESRKDRKKDRKKESKEERKKDRERSGRISESEPEPAPEPAPQPPVRTVPEEERRPAPPRAPEPSPTPPPEPETKAAEEPAHREPTPEPESRPAPERPTEPTPSPAEPAAPEPTTPEIPEPVEPPAAPEPAPRRDRAAERPTRLPEDAGPPPAVSDVRTYQTGTCSDCKPGEAATSVLTAAGKGTGSGCAAGFLGVAQDALEELGGALSGDGYTGPLVIDGRIVAVAPEPAQSAAQSALAPYIRPGAPCQLLAVVLSPAVKFTGYRYEARQGSRGGDCLAGQDCPIGGALWPDHPSIERTDQATFVYAVFENRTDAERVAELTVYFDPTP